MTEETAKALIEALNRFSAAIEAVTGPGYMGGKALNIHHQGHPTLAPQTPQPFPGPAPYMPHPQWGSWGGNYPYGG